jgi:CHAT domain-containing protein
MEVLAEDYTVSYALSGTLHAHLRLQTKPIGRGLLALGDPIFQASKVSEKPQPVPPGGVLLTLVQPGSNAAQAGLRPNDVLLRYGETELKGTSDLKVLPASEDAAQRVAVTVWRQGQTLERRLNPGQLGVGLADPPAPQAWAEQRRRHGLLASRSGDDGWKELPGTRAETESLGRLFGPATPVKLLLDSDASEQNLNEMAQKGNLGQYRYLHLATHGEVDDSWALRSAGL